MPIRIEDRKLEVRLARIARKQKPPTNKRQLALAMLREQCRLAEESKDADGWKGRER